MEGVDSPTEGRNAPHHHEPSLMPLKPILKKPSAKKLDIGSVEITPHATAISNEDSGSSASGVTWDEPTIAEHDKERGTRTKISEPKTPYHADASSDDESAHLNGSNSMDLDTSGTDGDHEDSHHHATKLSPRFILPENKKKHHRHHHHTHESDGTTSSSGSSGVDVVEMRDDDQGRTGRKLRLQAEPLSPSIDVSVLQQRMAQVEQERATDDKRMQQDGKDDIESGSNSGESDSDDDEEEFLTPQERAKKAAFEKHRKQHYDEFRRMKELMQRGSDDADSSSSGESDD